MPFIIFFLHIPVGERDDAPSEAKTTLRDKVMQVDPVGIVLVMGGIVALIQALHFGGSSKPWSSATVIGLLAGSVAIGITFAIWEWHQGERAAIPPRLMADRNVLVSSLYTAFFAGSYFIVIYYLPIYFQAIDDVSATMSGVRNLPLIISVSVTILVSSAIVSQTGAKPLLLAGASLATIGCGLFYTLGVGSSPGRWIGFQFLAGVGWGLSFQLPIIIVQGTVAQKDIGPATAIILCTLLPCIHSCFPKRLMSFIQLTLQPFGSSVFQTVGAAFFLAAAQSAFLNQSLVTLRTSAPGVNAAMFVATGSAQLRSVFTADDMPGVLAAYMAGLKSAFVLSTVAAALAFVVAIFDVNKPLAAHDTKPDQITALSVAENKQLENTGNAMA